MRLRFAVPLGLFVTLVVVLAVGLTRDPRLLPSPLIGKPLPAFNLASLATIDRKVSRADLLGHPYLLNVWASWCVACRDEHALLIDLGHRGKVDIIGLNYKDEREAASHWLRDRGDPYRLVLCDPLGQLGLDLGVYGVPETFVIDAAGVIRHKHVGPLTDAVLAQEITPLLAQLGTRAP